jgi:diacylglycerol kinase (ATP)
MSEFKKVLFIVNKYSGKGYEPDLEGRIIETCASHSIECTINYTTGRGHATELAKTAIGNYDAILAVGGDGTVNEVARALVFSSTPMGILPKGSGNGLARHLHIPLALEQALDSFFNGTLVHMDTFLVNGYLSVNVSGLGFDGHIANLFDGEKKRGLWGYFKLILQEYFRYAEFDWDLHVGKNITHFNSFVIAIANSSQYGNNAFVAPQASVTDGFLNLSLAHKIPLYKGLSFAIRLFTKNLKNSELFESHPIQNVSITSLVPVAFHVDGEPCGYANSFTIEPLPRSLKIIIPSNNKS